MSLHKRWESNLRFPGKDPEREQKIQPGWVEKEESGGEGPRRFCINF